MLTASPSTWHQTLFRAAHGSTTPAASPDTRDSAPKTLSAAPQVCFPSSSFFVSFTWCSMNGCISWSASLHGDKGPDVEKKGLVSPG